MTTISHTQLCAGLKISRARVDQWLSRGFITLETETMSGRVRQWTERDAITLAALKDMAEANLPLEQVAPHIHSLTCRNQDAYLVIYYGPHRLIPSSRRGDPAPNSTTVLSANGRKRHRGGSCERDLGLCHCAETLTGPMIRADQPSGARRNDRHPRRSRPRLSSWRRRRMDGEANRT